MEIITIEYSRGLKKSAEQIFNDLSKYGNVYIILILRRWWMFDKIRIKKL